MRRPVVDERVSGEVGLPPVVFLFTIDQIASMLQVSEQEIMLKYLYFVGRSSGPRKPGTMRAINVAMDDEKAQWRVDSWDFVRWLKSRGYKLGELNYFR